jgi:hypothetical protein
MRLLPEKGRRVALNCANQGQGAVRLDLFFDLTQFFVLHFRRNTCLGLFRKFKGLHLVVKMVPECGGRKSLNGAHQWNGFAGVCKLPRLTQFFVFDFWAHVCLWL